MKKMMAVVLLLGLAVTAFAGESLQLESTLFQQAETGFKNALMQENEGVRLSALFALARTRFEYPKTDFSSFDRTLVRLAKNDPSDRVQLYAKLTHLYLTDNSLVTAVPVVDVEAPQQFYKVLFDTAVLK